MTAQDVLEASYTSVLDALAGADDQRAWRPTRCAGWSMQDLVHHLLSDAQRALVALNTAATRPVDTDAISYWWPFRPGSVGGDADRRHTRVMASVWTFGALRAAYTETAQAAIVASNSHSGDDIVTTQGKVLTVDSLRSTLAVEATVHHLDLQLGQPSRQGLSEVRKVLDGMLGQPAPIPDDARYALLGTGREEPTPKEARRLGGLSARLPLFG